MFTPCACLRIVPLTEQPGAVSSHPNLTGYEPRVSQLRTIMSTPHDVLSNSVPKLDPSWKNWPIFAIRFVAAVRVKGVYGHFDGSSPYPTTVNPKKLTEDEAKAIVLWDKDEAQAYYMLQQKIPDSLLLRVAPMENVAKHWIYIRTTCTSKSLQTSTAEHQAFLNSKCGEKENIHTFLEKLCEELLQSSVVIEESDYLSTIISALPIGTEIHHYANQHLTSMQHHANKMLQFHRMKGESQCRGHQIPPMHRP